MNITLSADKKLIEKSRKYAIEHNTTLNSLVRGYLKQICGKADIISNAEEFEELARNKSGKSPKNFKFNRNLVYDRNS